MNLNIESQLVLAANASMTLTNRIVGYLHELQVAARNYRGYRNPLKKVDDHKFTVTILQMLERNNVKYVQVAVTTTETVVYTSPTYYDPDDDMFDESWGADNTSGTCVSTSYHTRDHRIDIPFSHLLMPLDKVRENLKANVAYWTEQDELEVKKEKIARLEKELAEARKL